ncbi:hypothetical protein ACGVWS_05765 [Enterobacteriaceae bacterium LUAb1]
MNSSYKRTAIVIEQDHTIFIESGKYGDILYVLAHGLNPIEYGCLSKKLIINKQPIDVVQLKKYILSLGITISNLRHINLIVCYSGELHHASLASQLSMLFPKVFISGYTGMVFVSKRPDVLYAQIMAIPYSQTDAWYMQVSNLLSYFSVFQNEDQLQQNLISPAFYPQFQHRELIFLNGRCTQSRTRIINLYSQHLEQSAHYYQL